LKGRCTPVLCGGHLFKFKEKGFCMDAEPPRKYDGDGAFCYENANLLLTV